MRNVKYYAGLFDADGSFDFRPMNPATDGSHTVQVKATLYQKNPKVLYPLAEEFGGKVSVNPAGVHYVTLQGKRATRLMEQLRPHLVIKGRVVDFLLQRNGERIHDLKAFRAEVKAARAETDTEKNYPTRKWMAGYVDGDGWIGSSYRKKDGNIEFKMAVVSHRSQRAGLDLIHKAFGGLIVEQGDVLQWRVSLSVTKGQQVLGFFSQHLQMKREQAALVLEHLRTGQHLLRRGATPESNLALHRKLQELKATSND